VADDDSPTATRIKFVFKYADNYDLVAANGVWVGITPRGDVRLDFFVEGFQPPLTTTHPITVDGSIGTEIAREPPVTSEGIVEVIRRLQVGIMIPGNQLESLGTLLSQKATELKALGKSEDDSNDVPDGSDTTH
jgi:hypothetical protein